MSAKDFAGASECSSRSWEECISETAHEFWSDPSDVFQIRRRDEEDEAALRQAALEKLSSSRSGIRDLENLVNLDRKIPIDRMLETREEENEGLLRHLRKRLDSVGIELPKIEIRFENLSVEADAFKRTNPVFCALEGLAGLAGLSISKKTVNKVLTDISGILRPSRMVLLLGPPGAGKTTLLRALAGKLDKGLRVDGKVTYCGHELTEFIPERTSAYIGQRDVHLGEMTVRETLNFSWRCQGAETRFHMLSELARREQEMSITQDPQVNFLTEAMAPEYILKMLGLHSCADILVGDDMRRGISGGQKKRLTTGEILVGPARALFMDGISNGLDTSTTVQIIRFIRQIVQTLDATVVMALVQPVPEIFNLFDDIILLSEGKILYQGPREKILEFLGCMGFQCPEGTEHVDFLQKIKFPVNELVNGFKSFHLGQQLRKDLEKPYVKSETHPSAISTDGHGVSIIELFRACVEREWLLMKRNSFVYIFTASQLILLAGMGSSVFPRTRMRHETMADAGKYFGALFYGSVIVLFNGAAEMAITVERLPVHYKQRDLMFYPGWVFGLPVWLLRIPISLLESAIWVVITYYSIGFAPAADRFFRQFLVFFCLHQTALSWFRLAAAAGRSIVATTTYGTIWMVTVFVLSGFVISKDNLGVWWVWGYWTSPMMYAQNALAINEFLHSRWNKPSYGGATTGTTFLKSRGLQVEEYWYWISIGALVLLSFIYNLGFLACCVYLNPIEVSRAPIKNDEGEKVAKGFIAFRSSQDNKEIIFAANGRARTALPFTPLSLAFKHLNYYVDMPAEMKKQGVEEARLRLLCDVSGAFRPGILTALVGVSGAGKTTLLDVLAGRKTGGYVEGSIHISGYPKNPETFARVSGYCEQNDIHSPNITVYEALLFSAWLRLPRDVDPDTRQRFVEEVMELIELGPQRNTLTGLPGVNGLSTEQRKRFTVAVELVANPAIIFMDEPTSGLDGGAAAVVLRTVRNIANMWRTVVCTIHQPSTEIFESFDELLLMKLGGQVIYAGPLGRNSRSLVDYFEGIPGVPKIMESQNPASWMLEITSPSMEVNLKIDFVDVYSKSHLCQRNQKIIEELSTPYPSSADLFFRNKYAQSFVTQLAACFWKQHRAYWRNSRYNGFRFSTTLVMGLLLGTLFWNRGQHRKTQQDVSNVVGAMYCLAFFLGPIIGTAVQPVVAIERTVYYRERAAVMYSPFAYAFAQVSVEVAYILCQAVLFSVIFYPLVGFTWQVDKVLWFIFFAFMCFLYFAAAGMMSVAITPTNPVAAVVIILFFHLWNIFSGFFIYRPMLPRWWKWCYWTSPVAWTVYGLTVSQLGDSEEMIQIPGQASMTVKAFLKEVQGYEHEFLGYVAAAHIGFVIAFSFVFAFGIKFFRFERR